MPHKRQTDIALVFVSGLIATLLIRLPYFGLESINSDEGLYAAVARAMQQGGIPYRDAWDHAAPGIFTLYYLLFKLFGEWNMDAVRWTAFLAHGITGILPGLFMLRKYELPAGIMTSALVVITIGGYLPADVIAAITETFMLPFLAGFMILMINKIEGEKVSFILPGLLLAFAIWFKIHALQISLFMCAGFLIINWKAKQIKLSDIYYLGGIYITAGIIYLILVAPIFLRGGFEAYWALYIKYNIRYFEAGSYDSRFIHGLIATIRQWTFPHFAGFLLGIAGIVALFFDKSKWRVGVLLTSSFIGSFVMSLAGARLFGHYFLPAMFVWGWIAGIGCYSLYNSVFETGSKPAGFRSRGIAVALLALAIIVPTLYFHGAAYHARWIMLQRDIKPGNKFVKLTRQVQSLTGEDDMIWVWGFAPEVYIGCRRDCANRFINCHYLVGLIPWENIDPEKDTSAQIFPGSWELLKLDLNNQPPQVIIDCSTSNYQFFGKYPPRKFPGLHKYITENYLDTGVYDGFRVYQKRARAIIPFR